MGKHQNRIDSHHFYDKEGTPEGPRQWGIVILQWEKGRNAEWDPRGFFSRRILQYYRDWSSHLDQRMLCNGRWRWATLVRRQALFKCKSSASRESWGIKRKPVAAFPTILYDNRTTVYTAASPPRLDTRLHHLCAYGQYCITFTLGSQFPQFERVVGRRANKWCLRPSNPQKKEGVKESKTVQAHPESQTAPLQTW